MTSRNANSWVDLPGVDLFPEERWQTKMKNIQESCGSLFNRELLSDIAFIVGEEKQRIPAHKLLLSCMSPVFHTQFNGSLSANEKEINVPDIDPAGFLTFLRYIYTDSFDADGRTVISTLYAAKKYDVPILESKCQELLIKSVETENAFALLTQGQHFEQMMLCDQCLSVIDSDTKAAMETDSFLEIDLDCLCLVLRRESLNIRESELFEAVIRWAQARCRKLNIPDTPQNQRAAIGEAFDHIRFSQMAPSEFALGPAMSGILTSEETVEIFLYLTASVDLPKKYQTHLRQSKFAPRFRTILSHSHQYGDSFSFTVSNAVYLDAFHLYGCAIERQPLLFSVSISIKSARLRSSYTTGTYNCANGSKTFVVPLTQRLRVSPNYAYEVKLDLAVKGKMKGNYYFYGTDVLSNVKVLGDVTVTFLPGSADHVSWWDPDGGVTEYNESCTQGQVAGMLFSE